MNNKFINNNVFSIKVDHKSFMHRHKREFRFTVKWVVNFFIRICLRYCQSQSSPQGIFFR
jgi:hypothetical protein